MVSRHLRRGAAKHAARLREALRAGHGLQTIRRGLRRQVTLQEGARPVDGAGLQLRRMLSRPHYPPRATRYARRRFV